MEISLAPWEEEVETSRSLSNEDSDVLRTSPAGSLEVDLNLFVVFDALLRSGSVSKAAEILDMTQSSTSKALIKLRRYYSDPLFYKAQNQMVPTERAFALSKDVKKLIEIARQSLVMRPTFDPETSDRLINISVDDIGELSVMPLLTDRLRAIAPNCRIRTIDDDIYHGLRSGKIDVAIEAPFDFGCDIRQQKLFEHIFVVIAHINVPAQETIDLQTFEQMDHVIVAHTHRRRTILAETMAKNGPSNPIISLAHWNAVPLVVATNPNSAAIVPYFVAQHYCNSDVVKVLQPEFEIPRIEINQYWHANADGDPFNMWLRHMLRDTLSTNSLLNITAFGDCFSR